MSESNTEPGLLQQRVERMSLELRRAEERAESMETRLHEILAELDQGISSQRPSAALEPLFAELSRLCHKINNPLTSLMGRAQMLQLKLAKGDAEQSGKWVQVIEESAKQVAAYVQELAQVVNRGREELLDGPDETA